MNNPFSVLMYALFPVIAAVTGAVIALVRPPGPVIRSYIQHLAAGVVFSVVAVELLPDIIRQHAPVEVIIGFVLGVVIMLSLRSLSHKLEKGNNGETERPIGLLVGVGVDILLDGFLIGVSFAAGEKAGKLLTFALTLELLSLGLAVATALGKTDRKKWRVLLITFLLFQILLVGTFIGGLLIHYISPSVMEAVLSFGLAALMYLVTEELLVEAHKEPETPMATGMFFLGFLVFLILGIVK